MTPTVLYEDAFLVVLDKPCGMPTQPERGRSGMDLASQVTRRWGYAGLHHRLDQPVSGVIVVAIHTDANAGLAAAFRERRVHKTYAAVLAGDLPVGTRRVWDRPLDGRTARTEVEIVGAGEGLLAAFLSPVTGRTHQLRRHAAQAGLPILGDRRYGGDAGGWLERLALHATRLELVHPVTGAPLAFTSPIPPDLEAVWQTAGGPISALPGPSGG